MPWGRTRVPRVEVVSREGCHLCEEMVALVRRVAGADVPVQVRDLDADDVPAELRERWSTLVPVLLVDGAEVARWRVDERTLRSALRVPGRVPSVRVLVQRWRRP
ncbi:glutaredoxin family protein [Ornithinimicrobium sp. W1665]|uniref:glutaredoxin family protein n=1 Tax=Ornithinimicrobium sp. W1665 TaxID=3416666 RepID=UPI003CED4D4B